MFDCTVKSTKSRTRIVRDPAAGGEGGVGMARFSAPPSGVRGGAPGTSEF